MVPSQIWSRSLALASLSLCALCAITAQARATPRLALVDGTELPFVHRALVVALAPWNFEIVDWPNVDVVVAPERIAARANTRYVVWYDGRQHILVVHDAALGAQTRRPLPAVPGDEPSAAALALSVKTMLRLSAPAQSTPIAVIAPMASAKEESRWRWIPHVSTGPRFALTGDGGASLRVAVGLEWSPPGIPMSAGLRWEGGTRSEINGGGFKGEWSDSAVLLTAARHGSLASWSSSTRIAVGGSRGSLDGVAMQNARSERHFGLAGAIAGGISRRLGPFDVGASLSLAARQAKRYPRDNGASLFSEPGITLAAMVIAEFHL